MLIGAPWSMIFAENAVDGVGDADVLACSGDAGRRRLRDPEREKDALCWVRGEPCTDDCEWEE